MPNSTLVSLASFLADKRYRDSVLPSVSDPLIRSFWQDEFNEKPKKWQEEAIAPIQNKIGQFIASPLIRSIVGQATGKIDLRQAMDNGQILVANLSKGRIGEDATTLLGALLVTGVQQAAMARSDTAEKDRKDFFLYVDEFQNFATDSFESILSEARKYRLSLTIANQYLDQMELGIRNAVFGNVGSMLCFQVGTTDAEILAPQLAGDIEPLDLISTPKYHAYARLLIDGMPSKPFSMKTLHPKLSKMTARGEAVRKHSRRRFSRPFDQVKRQIDQSH